MSSQDIRQVPRPIVYMTGPAIRMYSVSDSELESIRVASGNVSQDFGFMMGSIGFFVTALSTLATLNPYSQPTGLGVVEFSLLAFVSATTALYTGWKWHRQRNSVSDIIGRIMKSSSGTSQPGPNEGRTPPYG